MSALTCMSTGTHNTSSEPGDTVVFSSKFIPAMKSAIAKIINNLFRKGAGSDL
ncbi:MAG: hypothetical protein R2874_01720 [Desulfobacterales bacterium]